MQVSTRISISWHFLGLPCPSWRLAGSHQPPSSSSSPSSTRPSTVGARMASPCPSLATILAVACRRNEHLIIGDAGTSHHALPRERRHIFSIEKTGNETMNRHRQYKSWGVLKLASRHLLDLTTMTAVIGAPFLPFQWDILLLEVGGLAVLASPILPLMSGDEWECPIAVVAALRCLVSPWMQPNVPKEVVGIFVIFSALSIPCIHSSSVCPFQCVTSVRLTSLPFRAPSSISVFLSLHLSHTHSFPLPLPFPLPPSLSPSPSPSFPLSLSPTLPLSL